MMASCKPAQRFRPSSTSKRLACVLIVASFCTSLVFIPWTFRNQVMLELSPEILTRAFEDGNQPLILLWTTVWQETVTEQRLKGDLRNLTCFGKEITCNISDERQLMPQASVLLFHARDVSLQDLPRKKFARQPWILWNHEAPHNSPIRVYEGGENLFDFELSYRHSADIYAPYGYIVKEHRGNFSHIEDYMPDLRKRFYSQVGAAWLVSNCKTEGGREDYVNELRQYFPVDVHGRCGNHRCQNLAADSCMWEISNKYMFYLAFENSLCPDYVTEKLFRTLQYPIIPVVLSGPRKPFVDGLDLFVDASNLAPKELALRLDEIARNFTQYAQYYTWRMRYSAYPQQHPLCHVCETIHKGRSHYAMLPTRRHTLVDMLNHKACRRWDKHTKQFEPVSTVSRFFWESYK